MTSLIPTWPEFRDFEIVEGTIRVFSPVIKGKGRREEQTDASRAREVEKFNITIPTIGNTRLGYMREEEENARISIYKRAGFSRESSFSPGSP